MSVESWLQIAKIFQYSATAVVAISAIAIGVLSSHVDKKKDTKIDDLLTGNSNLQKGNADLSIKIDKYRLDIVSKDEELKQINKKYEELKKVAEPRHLSDEVAQKLQSLVSFRSNFKIAAGSKITDEESYSYAKQFMEIFKKAGWQVGAINRTFIDNIESDVTIAVTGDAQTQEQQSPAVHRLLEIFNSLGINCKLEKIREGSFSGLEDSTIYLIFGAKLRP